MSEKGDVQMFYTHVQSEHLRNYPRFLMRLPGGVITERGVVRVQRVRRVESQSGAQ